MPDCPHCHHPLLTDPATGLAPARCPHCSAAISSQTARGPSLASFLRPDASTPPARPALLPSTRSFDAPAASPGPQDTPTTSHGALVHQPDPAADATAVPPVLQAQADQATGVIDLAPAQAGTAQAAPPEGAIDQPRFAGPLDSADAITVTAPAMAADTSPSFTRAGRTTRSHRVPTWQWAALATLTAALGLQMLMADRARLAQDSVWRPVLERACGVLRCALPPWHQPQAYTMLARDVKPVPGAAGVLQVRATFRNDARWPQAWPSIALSLSDADGRVAGARVLVPDDYLETAQRKTTLAPGQSGQMTVQVREPPGGVVAFAFAFR